MSSSKDEVGIKIAVQYESKSTPFLGVYNNEEPLFHFLQKLDKEMTSWELRNVDKFALRFTDDPKHYVTDSNRHLIKPGTVLDLVRSATSKSSAIVNCLRNSKEAALRLKVSEDLLEVCQDITFAVEFVDQQGLTLLIEFIENQTIEPALQPNLLQSFLDLMSHGIVAWDTVSHKFIQSVAVHITGKTSEKSNNKVIKISLEILKSIVLNSENHYQLVEKEVSLHHLIAKINVPIATRTQGGRIALDNDLFNNQKSVLALLNALFIKADSNRKHFYATKLSERQYRNIINHYILHVDGEGNSLIDDEMAHQLYVLQQLLLNQYEGRMRTNHDPEATEMIKELRRVAFESDGEEDTKDHSARRMEIKKEYKKLGFKDDINPAQDFGDAPPGMLALDNMIFFAREHSDKYSKLILENCCRDDSHDCPFGRASIELTRLLCDILKVGSTPSEDCTTYYPMLFSHEKAFEELFCICIVLLNKTWKDMKASIEDFSKVVNVVKEQIDRTLPLKLPTFLKYQEEINKLTYAKIAEIWLSDRLNQEEKEMKAPPILELRAQIEPEMMELIQQHRFNYLVQGSMFKHKTNRGREKHWYCRLSPNYKFFHYGECEEKTAPSIDELKEKVSVVEIKSLLTGKDCQHLKKNLKNASVFAFSLLLESSNVSENKSLDFITQDEMIFNYWTDGINRLLRQRMTSPAAEEDLKSLLDMEIKLRLLDAEGVSIPHQPPPIPSPPPNFNFCFQQS